MESIFKWRLRSLDECAAAAGLLAILADSTVDWGFLACRGLPAMLRTDDESLADHIDAFLHHSGINYSYAQLGEDNPAAVAFRAALMKARGGK